MHQLQYLECGHILTPHKKKTESKWGLPSQYSFILLTLIGSALVIDDLQESNVLYND